MNNPTEKEILVQKLGICTEIESNLYVLCKSVDQLNDEIDQLKNKKPTYKPNEPIYDSVSNFITKSIGKIAFNTVIMLIPFGITVALLNYYILENVIKNIIENIINTSISYKAASAITWTIELSIYLIFVIRHILRKANPIKELNKRNRKDYEDSLEDYENDIQRCNEYNKMATANREILEKLKNQTERTAYKVQDNVIMIYDDINIPYKYRNFVAIATIYDYFLCDRVDTLREAINMYEQESRLNTIITKLDNIIERLDAIQYTQSLLYREIVKANEKMTSYIDDINKRLANMNQSINENNQIATNILNECWLNNFNSSLVIYSNEKLRESLLK